MSKIIHEEEIVASQPVQEQESVRGVDAATFAKFYKVAPKWAKRFAENDLSYDRHTSEMTDSSRCVLGETFDHDDKWRSCDLCYGFGYYVGTTASKYINTARKKEGLKKVTGFLYSKNGIYTDWDKAIPEFIKHLEISHPEVFNK